MDMSQNDDLLSPADSLSLSKNLPTDRWLTWIAAGVAAFHIWANTFGDLSDLWRNALHLGLLDFLGFILYPGIKKRKPPKILALLNLILAFVILSTSVYLILFENALHDRNEVPVLSDLIFAGIALVLAIELA